MFAWTDGAECLKKLDTEEKDDDAKCDDNDKNARKWDLGSY